MNLCARITGTGSYLPPQRLSNADLVRQLAARGVQSSDTWIVERTGIQARYFASPEQSTSDLALQACCHALKAAGRKAQDVDLIVFATSTPDMVFPSTASILQAKLGITGCPAFDVQAVCTGFVYALGVADAMLRTGSAKCALVVGAEIFSRLLNFDDRGTCVLFGDGAGAVLLEASADPGILASDLHADGRYADILCVPGHVQNGLIQGTHLLHMNGQAVFKLAVNVLEQTARSVLQKAGKDTNAIDWFIPHQANIRIIQSSAKKLHLPMEKVMITVHEHANTSAASIPLALDQGVRSEQIRRGQTLLLQGVGGGFTWGSVLLVL